VIESADKSVSGGCHEVPESDLSKPEEEHGSGESDSRATLCDPPACEEVTFLNRIFCYM
jgi:hypothetical protein